MSKTETSTKTGTTPVVEEGIGGGKILGVVPVKTCLVHFVDGHGVESTKLAVLIPGGETYFFTRDAVDTRPAQTWLKEAIKGRI